MEKEEQGSALRAAAERERSWQGEAQCCSFSRTQQASGPEEQARTYKKAGRSRRYLIHKLKSLAHHCNLSNQLETR